MRYRVDRSNGVAVTSTEGDFLRCLAVSLRPTCIVEVGTGKGGSLRAFCDAAVCLNNGCEVWSCDISKEACEVGRELCPDAHIIHGPSDALTIVVNRLPELIFIDGDHTTSAVADDYACLSKIAAPGAVFLFHDACYIEGHQNGVMKTLERIGAAVLPTFHGIGIHVK